MLSFDSPIDFTAKPIIIAANIANEFRIESSLMIGSQNIYVSQIRCQLLLGWLSDGFPSGLSEYAYRQSGGTAE